MSSKDTLISEFLGMNRQADISNMSPKYLYDIFNGYISKSATLRKRFGYNKNFPVSTGEDNIAQYQAVYDDGSSDDFVCTPTKILRWNAAGPGWITLKSLALSISYVSIVQYGDDVVFSDGVNPTQKFTKGSGSTVDFILPDGVTSFKLLHIHENRLWAITNDYIPYFSALGDIEDWTASGDDGSGYLNLLAYISKGDEITSISTFSKAYLCFFMKEHILIYSVGTVASEFQILQTIINAGAKSELSVMSFGNDNYYLDNDSPKSLIASTTSQELDINDFVKGVMGNYYRDLLYAASGPRLCMTKYTRRSWIVIHVPIGSNSGELLIWDYAYKVWSGRWRVPVKINGIMQDRNGNLVFISNEYVYKFDETSMNDDGEAIEYVALPPFYYGRDPMAYERVPFIEFLAETRTAGTEIEVSCYFEYEAIPSSYQVVSLPAEVSLWDEALWDEALWDATGQGINRVRVLGRGKMFRVSFRNAQLDKDVELKYWKPFQKNLGYN